MLKDVQRLEHRSEDFDIHEEQDYGAEINLLSEVFEDNRRKDIKDLKSHDNYHTRIRYRVKEKKEMSSKLIAEDYP